MDFELTDDRRDDMDPAAAFGAAKAVGRELGSEGFVGHLETKRISGATGFAP